MDGVIYMYENKINKKVYIGKTIDEVKRIKSHLYESRKTSNKFYNAVRKYGWENFEYIIVDRFESSSKEELNTELSNLEIFYIKKFDSIKNGYNTTEGGEGCKGLKHSDSAKEKMSLRKKFLYENSLVKPRKKSILQFSFEGEFLKEWNSIKEASTELKLSRSHIINCCKGNRKSCGDFKWVYKDSFSDNSDFVIEKLKLRNKDSYLKKVCRNIYKLDGEGEIICEYESIGSAKYELDGKNFTNIRLCCKYFNCIINGLKIKKKRDFVYGFRWVYKEDYDNEVNRKKLKDYFEIEYKSNFIQQFTLSDDFIMEYKDSGEVNRITGFNSVSILNCCKGKLKTSHGFIWRYRKNVIN